MSLRDVLRRLAAMPPAEIPFTSVYLDLVPVGPGINSHPVFLKKRFAEEIRKHPERSPVRAALERLEERIQRHLDTDVPRGTRSVALFARTGNGEVLEAVHLPVALGAHTLVVAPRPYLYPLARIADLYPATLAAVVDTNTARLFVLALGQTVARREIHNENLHRPMSGGLSQGRIQRHVEDHYLHHAKQVAQALDRLVREHEAEHVLIGGDEVILPELNGHLTSAVREHLLAEPHWDIRIAEHELVAGCLERVRNAQRESRSRRATEILDTFLAGGNATAGLTETLWALGQGQVTELLVAELRNGDAWIEVCHNCGRLVEERAAAACPSCGNPGLRQELLYGLLVNEALSHGGEVRVVEAQEALVRADGVAAALRYR